MCDSSVIFFAISSGVKGQMEASVFLQPKNQPERMLLNIDEGVKKKAAEI